MSSVVISGDTSGAITLAAPAVAGTNTLSLPAQTATIATLTTPSFATTIGVGGATAAASGAGITFPSTQSASTDANTLDDYEEGTWTMVLEGTGGSAGSYAASINTGRYVKIGRFVYVTGYIVLTNKGSWTGNVYITGLPFTVNNGSDSYSLTSVYYVTVTLAGTAYGIVGYPQINSSRIELTKNQATTSGVAVDFSELANNSQIGPIGLGYYASA
jgi:hypothetical protein